MRLNLIMYTVTQIIDIKPYQIAAKFNTGEIRTLNFAPLVEKFTDLKDPVTFLKHELSYLVLLIFSQKLFIS